MLRYAAARFLKLRYSAFYFNSHQS